MEYREAQVLEVERWRDWRRDSNGLTWRVALPSDLPAIERVWRTKATVVGVDAPLPDLFAPPVILAIVAENADGRIVDGAFLEAVIDVTKIGARVSGFQSLTGIADELAAFVRSRKFRRITAVMPPRLSGRMAEGLAHAGFERQQLHLWEKAL